jgi:molybdenum cofactor synthesis domain-containing protein
MNIDGLKVAVVVCSDTVSKKEKEDISGKKIIERLQQLNIETNDYTVIADDVDIIQLTLKKYVADKFDMVIFTGGTGLSKRDNTPDAIKPLIEKEVPGIAETARSYGQQRMPFAMLSRNVAGFIQNTLVLTFPGSVRGVEETMDALFPQVLHVFAVRKDV